jgi:hypothetical protein
MSRAPDALREPVLGLVAIVAFCSVAMNWVPMRVVPASDFYQFWVVGQELAAGRAGDVYADAERERIGGRYLQQALRGGDRTEVRTARQRETLETYSTPFLYTVFAAFSSGDYDRDLARYRVFSLASLLFAVVVLCRLLGYGALSTLAALAILGSWFAPVRSDWLVGNVNCFQLAGLAVFAWLVGRRPDRTGSVLAGFVLALGAMFKPNSAPVILLLFVAWGMRRRSEKLAFASVGIVAGMVFALVWSSVGFGDAGIWWSWASALSRLPDELITLALGNHAASRLAVEAFGVDVSVPMAVVCGTLVGFAMLRGLWGEAPADPPERAGLEDLHVVALASVLTLLVSPLAWLHYYVATIPMLLIVLRPEPAPARRGGEAIVLRGVVWLVWIAVMMRPLVVLGVSDDFGRAVLLCLGTAVLFVLGLRSLLRFAPGADAGGAAGR